MFSLVTPCAFLLILFPLSAGSKVFHPQHLGKLVQARNAVKGSGRQGLGRQIHQSVHGQPAQSEMLMVSILDYVTVGRNPTWGLFFCWVFLLLGWFPISER